MLSAPLLSLSYTGNSLRKMLAGSAGVAALGSALVAGEEFGDEGAGDAAADVAGDVAGDVADDAAGAAGADIS